MIHESEVNIFRMIDRPEWHTICFFLIYMAQVIYKRCCCRAYAFVNGIIPGRVSAQHYEEFGDTEKLISVLGG